MRSASHAAADAGASALRDTLEARLRAEHSELSETAEIGLAGTPQLRDVLGLLER